MNKAQTTLARPICFSATRLPGEDLLPKAALLAAALLWGGSFAAMRVTVQAMSPWTVMWCRMAIALLILLPFSKRLVQIRYRRGDWKLLIPMVLLQPCLYFFLESYALQYTTSSQAGVIAASVPLMVTAGAWLCLAESINSRTLTGLVLSVGGVVSLTFLGGSADIADNPLLGNTLEFFAMASAAANMIIIKNLSSRYSTWSLTAMQVVAGSLFFLPGLYFLITSGWEGWDAGVVFAIIFLGVCVTLGAFGLYNWAIGRIPATQAAVYINLVPVIAVMIGWGVLGEALTPMQCLAAGTVIIGVWFSQKSTGTELKDA